MKFLCFIAESLVAIAIACAEKEQGTLKNSKKFRKTGRKWLRIRKDGISGTPS